MSFIVCRKSNSTRLLGAVKLVPLFLSTAARITSLPTRLSRTMASSTVGDKLNFDNRNLRSLPIDREKTNYTRTVTGACYSLVDPTPVENPVVVATSKSALALLGLSPDDVKSSEFAEYFSGSKIIPGSKPAAHCYCGHQFGHFSGQLGDGCAHYIGEVVNDRNERWELQFKGSGKTPYSRHADGRKVLRSSIREFLCSEAMHFLGVPTTRAGSCITSDSKVIRDIFYNGNNINERVTVITRIAPTFFRFGSFEIFKTQDPITMRTGPSVGMDDLRLHLIDYVVKSYYPEIHEAHPDDAVKRTGAFFQELCVRTAHLVAHWQCAGFCHGVLNTDNMSIVGITIDYGPYGFMDMYNPSHICNGSDDKGRYAFNKQPSICKWNLSKLGEALGRDRLCKEDMERGLEMYDAEFETLYLQRMRRKLGLIEKQQPEDVDLIESFHHTMHKTGCDFTNGFRNLNKLDLEKLQDSGHVESVADVLVDECAGPDEVAKLMKPKMSKSQLLQLKDMYAEASMLMIQLGITKELLDDELAKVEMVDSLKSTTKNDKKEADKQIWMKWLKSYVARLCVEIEGIPKDQISKVNSRRVAEMNSVNPRFILRNYLLQEAIEKAERNDFSEVERLLERAEYPYSDEVDLETVHRYFTRPPEEALELRVT